MSAGAEAKSPEAENPRTGWAKTRKNRVVASQRSFRLTGNSSLTSLNRRPSGKVQLHGDRVEHLRSCAVEDRCETRPQKSASLSGIL
jgi:acyl-homoserine lactone acylase PvdQ